MPRPKMLRMAPGLSLPQDAVTQTLAYVARKGAGKTYAAGKFVEGLYGLKAPFVVLDPVGNWYGLRLSADGQKPGLPIPVFGGEHGDVPLSPDSGAVIARLIIEKGIAAVVDVSNFRKVKRKQFVADFAEELFHLAKGVRSPLMVVFEEAQVFAPQVIRKGEERMVGAIEDIVRLGRNYGLGSTLITQRPQSVNKDVLNQVECLFVGQLNAKHERKAIEDWIVHNSAEPGFVKELPNLAVGEMMVWSPQWLNTFEKVKIGRKTTFDASATPKLGERRQIRNLAAVDIKVLSKAMQGAIDKAREEDPKLLRAQIRKLEAAIRKLQSATPEPEIQIEHTIESHPELMQLGRDMYRELQEQANRTRTMIDLASKVINHPSYDRSDEPQKAEPVKPTPQPAPLPKPNGQAHKTILWDGETLPKVERLMLITLCQHDPRSLDLAMVAIFAGYSPKTSSVKNGLGALRSKGLIVGGNSSMRVTDAGRQLVGNNFEPLATGDDLAREWLGRLSKCDRTMLEVILDAFPNSLNLTEVADAAGYSPNTSSVKNGLGHLRRLKLIEGMNDSMTANENLI